MNFILTLLRTLGWLIAMAIAIAAASASVMYAFRYGINVATAEAQPWLTGATLAVADVVKIGLPATIVALWTRAHWGTAGVLGAVFVMLLGLSLWASFSMTTIERAETDGKATKASKLEADLRTELDAADTRIAELGSPPPVKAVEAELDGIKADGRWQTTEACDPLHVTPSTRRFCEQAALKQSAREKAAEAEVLRSRMSEIRHILTSPPSETEKPPSPELTLVAGVVNWKPESVGLVRAAFFAVALELLSAFVPSALWLLRPSLSTPQPGSQRGTQSSESLKVAAALRGTSPRVSTPPPTSPRPPTPIATRRRGNREKTQPAGRGRKRDPNVLDFVRKFRERHGRSPNIPEMRAVFPSLHKSTLWRAAKSETGDTDSLQPLTA